MFERNIIDLVGLFVENVQSLYPFLEDPVRGTSGSASSSAGLQATSNDCL